MGLLNITPLYPLPVFKQMILQFCLCLGGIFKTNKQKLMKHGLSPNQLWEMLVSMDARNPEERREMVGGKGPLPDLEFLLPEETGKS